MPAVSLGLRDFIGTGWYSSEYIVGSKSVGNLDITAGLGFGRLADRNPSTNPFGKLFSQFKTRGTNNVGKGGTLGNINWFQGDVSVFYGLKYQLGEKIVLLAEYTSDAMIREGSYLDIKEPWNIGLKYILNDYVSFDLQHLHGSQISLTAQVAVNPNRPPLLGGMELAPVPMRLRGKERHP